MTFEICRKFNIKSKRTALLSHFFRSKKAGQFEDIINIEAVPNLIRFIYHAHIVKNIEFSHYKLKQNYSNWPDIRLIWLLWIIQNCFKGHICFCSYFIATYYLQAICKFSVYFDELVHFTHVFLLLFHFDVLLFKGCHKLRIHFSQSEINNHASFCIWVIKKVIRLYISMKYS